MNYLVQPNNPTIAEVLAYGVLIALAIVSFIVLFLNFLNWSMSAESFRLHLFTVLYHICYYLVHKYVKASHDS